MAESLLQILLENLTSFIQGEVGLILGFKDEFETLQSTFTTIQAVLEDAQEKQLKDKPIENWLQKLNVAVYEADDILDECKTEAARLKQTKYGSYHPKAIAFRYKIGKKMKNIMKKLDAIAADRIKFHFEIRPIDRQAARPQKGSVLTEKQVYGRGKEEDEIVKILINNAQQLSVLPILGLGGLGKTTLAQMVFDDQRVAEHFHPKIWICVSDVFEEKRLIKAIIEYIEGNSVSDMDLAPLQKKLQELLNGKRYLLVLDDVWNEIQQKWADLRAVLNVGASGASVLTTTRIEKVGSIMGTLQPYELSYLSQEDCLSLIMQSAFGQQKEINPNLVAIGKEIVKKCGGVPLAAKTLGGILLFKREEREWENVRDSEIWNLPQDESSILSALRLSYHHLPLDLKQCFVYSAVFPKDAKMEKENLIFLWMAHGFLSSKGNLELEDVGSEVWNELYLRSFFQEIEVKDGKTYFKMHDLIHDLATSLFSANTSNINIREINVVVHSNMMHFGLIKEVDYTYRKPIGFAKVVSYFYPSLLKQFVSLRVLNLSNLDLQQLPSSIGDLVHLRYLNLSCNNMHSLPERLCKLKNLQTLDLHGCHSLCCLPKQTSKLGSLRNLVLDDYNSLTCMPTRIGSLTSLKTLGHFAVRRKKGSQLGELRNLNLYGSISIRHLERVKNDMDAKEANLSAKANLRSLSLIWYEPHSYESEEVKVLEALKPHPNLTSLRINDFIGSRLPDWINHSVLKNVVSITIRGCENCSCLPPFGELPCLETLVLRKGSAEYVDVHSGFPTRRRFPSLRKLCISEFPNLKGLLKKEGEDQFPVLEEMEIAQCPVFVFPTLSSVKKLKFVGEADATGFRSISNLRALTSLIIRFNKEATSLPEEMFKSLANLKYLEIFFFMNLKELPTSLASLNALQSLTIDHCDALENFAQEGLEGLTSLTLLSVKSCRRLKCLPKGLQQFSVLEEMTIQGCPMLVFPTLSSVKKLKFVGTADATGLRSISNLRALTSLNISYNYGATSLPEEMFKNLANLKDLTVSDFENLKELPTSLASLNALESLKIEFCYALESLPEEGVKGLSSLKQLIVYCCEMLKCLPDGLQHLTTLTSLEIRGCPQLIKRCEKGIGEDWHKLAHIPYLNIPNYY